MADDGALTLRADLSKEIREAAHTRGYTSPEELVREALAEWKARADEPGVRFARLRAAIQVGLDDIAAGRIVDIDFEEIKARGRRRLRSK